MGAFLSSPVHRYDCINMYCTQGHCESQVRPLLRFHAFCLFLSQVTEVEQGHGSEETSLLWGQNKGRVQRWTSFQKGALEDEHTGRMVPSNLSPFPGRGYLDGWVFLLGGCCWGLNEAHPCGALGWQQEYDCTESGMGTGSAKLSRDRDWMRPWTI